MRRYFAALLVTTLGACGLNQGTSKSVRSSTDMNATADAGKGPSTPGVTDGGNDKKTDIIPTTPTEETKPLVPGTPAANPNYEVTLENGINYCKNGNENLVLDLARPKAATGSLPGIVFVHGGGWTSGSRNAFSDDIRLAAARGYVAVTIDYRLSGQLFPGQIEDVKCAIRWLKANADTYKVDKNRVALFGMSAGAHLSMMAAFTNVGQFEGSGGHAAQSSRAQVVVNWYGPADMAALYASTTQQKKLAFQAMFGGTPAAKPDAYDNASPVTYVNAGDPPVKTYHGTSDGEVPVRQADLLDARLKAAGVTHSLTKFEGAPHNFAAPFYGQAQQGSLDFLDTYIRTK